MHKEKWLTVTITAAAATPPTPQITAFTEDAFGAVEARRGAGPPTTGKMRGLERAAIRSPMPRVAMLTSS